MRKIVVGFVTLMALILPVAAPALASGISDPGLVTQTTLSVSSSAATQVAPSATAPATN